MKQEIKKRIEMKKYAEFNRKNWNKLKRNKIKVQ